MCFSGILRFAADGRRPGVLLSQTGDHSGIVTLASHTPVAAEQEAGGGDVENRSD